MIKFDELPMTEAGSRLSCRMVWHATLTPGIAGAA